MLPLDTTYQPLHVEENHYVKVISSRCSPPVLPLVLAYLWFRGYIPTSSGLLQSYQNNLSQTYEFYYHQ